MNRHVLRSPAEVVAAVPALLGFKPQDSMVALCLSASDRTLICTAKFDLAMPTIDLERSLRRLVCGVDGCVLLLVRYADIEVGVVPLVDELRSTGVNVIDVLNVSESTFRSLLCTDSSCCPPEGIKVPEQTTVLEAARVVQGLPVVASDRGHLETRYQLGRALPEEVMERAKTVSDQSLPDRCHLAVELLEGLASGITDPAMNAELVWLLQDVNVRDHVLCTVALPSPESVKVDAIVATALVAPAKLQPRLAGTAAALLYATGTDSVGVWAMVDHAGDDSLALLVAQAMFNFVPPTEFRKVLECARVEVTQRIQEDAQRGDHLVPEAC